MTNPIVVEHVDESGDRPKKVHYYFCPGCETMHGVSIKQPGDERGWDFSGTLEKPTYSPSQLTTRGDASRCHTFIAEGMIQFLSDCTHALKDQTVPLPPVPDWMLE